ncbi:hypothetical protein BKA61DRAFT_585199 [Leptodontidium sp. MPI-SDFR-AT-0119]|nr:hypothetical protein BKA61DRAFT_585199 [Leptodontidium sp. MPI-SDFR-AT-0119]
MTERVVQEGALPLRDRLHLRQIGNSYIGFLKALPPVWGDVSSLKDLNISAMIHTSLDNLLMKGYKLMGSRRMENDGHDNIYFRLAHIGGSPKKKFKSLERNLPPSSGIYTSSVIGGGTISADRCHKQSRWEQSDRLKQGTIVALATHRDLMSAVRAGLAYMTVAKAYGLPAVGSLVGPNSVREFTSPNGSQPNPFPPTFTSTTVSVVISLCVLTPRILRESRRCADAQSEEWEAAA